MSIHFMIDECTTGRLTVRDNRGESKAQTGENCEFAAVLTYRSDPDTPLDRAGALFIILTAVQW
jgi:hypothetical protein